jgi:hypothetical protein
VRLIRTDEVIYFESDSRYTRIVFAGGDALIRTPLKELLAQLDEQIFWQVHRSVIVNHAARGRGGARGRRPHAPDAARPQRDPAGVTALSGLFKGQ